MLLPTLESAGQPAGLASNCADVHAFCSVVKRDGSCLGRSTLTDSTFDCCWPGSRPACPTDTRSWRRGWPRRSRGLPRSRDFEVWLELQALTRADLEVTCYRAVVPCAASRCTSEGHRRATGRVEHEFRPVDHGVDRAQIRGNSVDDRRERIRRDSQLRGQRSTSIFARTICVCRVNGPTTTAQRSTVRTARPLAAGQVDRRRRLTRLWHDQRIRSGAGLDHGVPDLRCRRACPLRRLRFAAQRDLRDHAEQALGHLELQFETRC